jgi:hypothetical protein
VQYALHIEKLVILKLYSIQESDGDTETKYVNLSDNIFKILPINKSMTNDDLDDGIYLRYDNVLYSVHTDIIKDTCYKIFTSNKTINITVNTKYNSIFWIPIISASGGLLAFDNQNKVYVVN